MTLFDVMTWTEFYKSENIRNTVWDQFQSVRDCRATNPGSIKPPESTERTNLRPKGTTARAKLCSPYPTLSPHSRLYFSQFSIPSIFFKLVTATGRRGPLSLLLAGDIEANPGHPSSHS